jgi:hypothetical protein
MTRKNKANNYTNAKCENGVRLIGWVYTVIKLFNLI